MNRFKLNRRTVLRGVIGGLPVAIGLPHLEAMLGKTALAQTAAPKRLGLWMWGNGVKMPQWRPTSTGANWTPGVSTMPLADAAIKSYVNIISGLNVKAGNERGHHSGVAALFSGSAILPQDHPNSNYKSTFSQPSLDIQLSNELKPTTKFPHIEFGVSNKVAQGEGTTTTYFSHSNPDSPNPAEYDAGKIFDRVFGAGTGGGTTPAVTDATNTLRKSVLDAVKTDIGNLQKRVGAQDKARLDQHLTNIRAIETQIASTGAGGGGGTTTPPATCGTQTKPAAIGDTRNKEDVQKRNQVMSDLIAVTLACDYTRIFSLHFSGAFGYTNYWQANAAITTGHHDLTHNEAGDQPQTVECTTFIMAQLAYLLKKLQSTPDVEINGKKTNLLDNIVVLASSDVSDGLKHTITDYPIVVAGGGTGFLKNPGVHVKGSGGNTSDVLLSVMMAAGSSIKTVGTKAGASSAPFTAIHAG